MYITPSVERLLGYLPRDFYEDPNFFLQLVDQKDIPEINRLFDYPSPEQEKHAVLRIFRKNLQPIWTEITTAPVYEGEKPIALAGVIRDITTIKEAEEQMLMSKKAKEVFLSYISHELKTPITSLLAYVMALKDNTFETKEKKDEAIEVIYKKVLTLERLIYDLFQLSKLETGQFSFDFMVMDGQDLAEALIRENSLYLKDADITMVLNIDKEALKGVSVIIDEARIQQVFSNILANAVRFSEKGGTIKFALGWTQKKTWSSPSQTTVLNCSKGSALYIRSILQGG